jgi:hypothetical protein
MNWRYNTKHISHGALLDANVEKAVLESSQVDHTHQALTLYQTVSQAVMQVPRQTNPARLETKMWSQFTDSNIAYC